MKNLSVSTIVFLLLSLSLQASPVDYLEKINSEYKNISATSWDYTSTVSHSKSARKANRKRKKLIKAIEDAQKNISSLEAYEGNSAYRDSVLSYLDITYKVMIEDYGNLMNLEEVAEQSYDAMEQYLSIKRIANEKLAASQERVSVELEKFCAQNNINLVDEESDLANKINLANEVYDYYNEIYLAFFKANIQEALLMAAIQQKNLSAIEQNKNALKVYAEEGLEKIKNIQGYKNDGSLLSITNKVLDFYKEEAEKDIPFISNFLMDAEQFEKLTAAMEKKKNKTQKDVDTYNKQVKEINKKSNEFNRKNQLLDNKRLQLVNAWNDAASSFIDRHVPK